MGKSLDDSLQLGQIVISKRGKDVGRPYVIIGFLDGNRLFLADARHFNVDRPKTKNMKHVQRTAHIFLRSVEVIKKGKNIDHGELSHFLNSLKMCAEGHSGKAGQ